MKIELRRKAHSGYAATDADVRIVDGEVEVKVRGGNTLRFPPSAQELLAATITDALTQRAQRLLADFRAMGSDELRQRLARMRQCDPPADLLIVAAAAQVMAERAQADTGSVTE